MLQKKGDKKTNRERYQLEIYYPKTTYSLRVFVAVASLFVSINAVLGKYPNHPNMKWNPFGVIFGESIWTSLGSSARVYFVWSMFASSRAFILDRSNEA